MTISATETDNKSGQTRSWMKFMGNITKGSMIRGITRATIYGLWIVAKYIFCNSNPKIGLRLGYTLMGLEGIRRLNEISSIRNRQN